MRERRGSLAAGFAALGTGRVLILVLTAVTLLLAVLAAECLHDAERRDRPGLLTDLLTKRHFAYLPNRLNCRGHNNSAWVVVNRVRSDTDGVGLFGPRRGK